MKFEYHFLSDCFHAEARRKIIRRKCFHEHLTAYMFDSLRRLPNAIRGVSNVWPGLQAQFTAAARRRTLYGHLSDAALAVILPNEIFALSDRAQADRR